MYIPDSLIDVYGARLGSTAVFVYLGLASQANAQGQTEPSIGDLETLLGLSRKTIRKGMARLVEYGLITQDSRQTRHGESETHLYTLCLWRGDFPQGRGDFPQGRGDFPQGRGDFPHGRGDFPQGRGDFPLPLFTGNRSEICTLEIPVPDPHGFLDPSSSQIQEEEKETKTKKKKHTYPPGFERCWLLHPDFRRHDKPGCLTLWKRDHLEARAEEIEEHLIAMNRTEEWYVRRIVPNFKKYLAERRYESPSAASAHGMTYTQEETDRILDEDDAWRATL
jgi:hypothetical protein